MNILSLFDGMSCAQIALNNLNIKYDNYFASEIDKFAMRVTNDNYPNTIHLGDIQYVNTDELPKIDLLIGGSPCTGFSYAGKQLNFDDPQSKLFFNYVKIIRSTQPTYFLLENVKMEKKYHDVITDYLGVEPVEINSKLVSAQNRPRMYWTNIPFDEIKDKNIKLINILENITFDCEPYEEKYKSNVCVPYTKDKFNTLRAYAGSKTRGIGICNENGFWRKLTPLECERLQTVPDNYTSIASNKQRYRMLGNGFTVKIIEHILSGII